MARVNRVKPVVQQQVVDRDTNAGRRNGRIETGDWRSEVIG